MPDFIIENQYWFIGLAILIVMAIIGYVADKNDIGKKKKKTVRRVEPTPITEEEPYEMTESEVAQEEGNFYPEQTIEMPEEINEMAEEAPMMPESVIEVMPTEEITFSENEMQNTAQLETIVSDLGVDAAILEPLEGSQPNDEFGIDNVPVLHADHSNDEQNPTGDVWKF
jgi:hypothetical protein